MRKYTVGVLLAIGAFSFVMAILTSKKEEPKPPIEFSAKLTGRKILFNPKELSAKPGIKAMAMPGLKQIEGLNAYILPEESNGQKIMSAIPKGWEISEEQEYSIAQSFQFFKCERIPEPTPTPTPGPLPQPTPGPSPNCEASKSWGREKVRACQAQALVDTSNVKVCVIDTGIDMNHPNKGNVIGSIGFAGAVQDRQGHGTHTAGTVAGTGGVGISRSSLLVCKGLSDSGSGTSSGLAQCLTWCGQQGAQIVSNSWGATQSDALINSAINSLTQRGIYVFVAAGNDGGPVNWPAKLAGANSLVYAIAASNQSDQIASFSSRGPEVRFISPGQGITSNWPGGGTRSLQGTSMATPHAAGICAFGIAKGQRPCIKTNGSVAGYPFADALETAK